MDARSQLDSLLDENAIRTAIDGLCNKTLGPDLYR